VRVPKGRGIDEPEEVPKVWRAVLATTGAPGSADTSSGVLVLDVTDPAALALQLQDGDEPVVVASHVHDAHAVAVAASFLVAHRPGRLVAHVASRHAPLATLVCLSTSLELSSDAGHGVSVWKDLMDASWSGVVLGSVAGLTHPDPPLSQHVRSWFPGSRFLVRLEPEPLSARANRPAAVLTGIGRGTHDMFVTEGGADDELVRRLTTTLAPAGVRPLALPGSWGSVFGRREQLQLALVPTDVRRRLRPRGPVCPGCGLSAAGAVCSFCRTRTAAPPAPPVITRPATGHLDRTDVPDRSHPLDPTDLLPGDSPAAPSGRTA